jgi:anaerobic magnesium-protoporphyrin IX monomethyl ester cyclase
MSSTAVPVSADSAPPFHRRGRTARVCLVNPPPHRIQERRYDTPLFVRPALACLGATLREAGIDCVVVDAKFERLSEQQVLERVRASGAQIVGLTAFTNEIKPAARIAHAVKERVPHVRTLIGGVHVTAIPRRTMLEFPEFDIACIGQGDRTIVELVAALDGNRPLETVAGLMWREGDEIMESAQPAPPPSVRDLPVPAWDLLPAGTRYHLMTARGCPYNCNFCANPNGRIVQRRTIEQIIAECEHVLSTFSPTDPINIWFDDEIFTVDMKRTHVLCDAILAAGLQKRMGWWAQTHVNVIDEPLLRKMKEAGCKRVGLGLESADESVLRNMGKGSTVERAYAACRAAERVGMPLETFFILGHPGETAASARNTIDFAVRINPEFPIFGIMVPYPGTHVAEMAERGEGGYRLISHDWNDYNKQIGGALEFEHLSRFQMEWIQTVGYLKVFWKNARYADLARFVWTYRREAITVLRKWGYGMAAAVFTSASRQRGELRTT